MRLKSPFKWLLRSLDAVGLWFIGYVSTEDQEPPPPKISEVNAPGADASPSGKGETQESTEQDEGAMGGVPVAGKTEAEGGFSPGEGVGEPKVTQEFEVTMGSASLGLGEYNCDHVVTFGGHGSFFAAVCDGVGKGAGAGPAAQRASTVFIDSLLDAPQEPLEAAFQMANLAVIESNQAGAYTTLIGASIRFDGLVRVGWCGNGAILRAIGPLTENPVQILKGMWGDLLIPHVDRSQGRKPPLSRSVGKNRQERGSQIQFQVDSDEEWLVLCTDGVLAAEERNIVIHEEHGYLISSQDRLIGLTRCLVGRHGSGGELNVELADFLAEIRDSGTQYDDMTVVVFRIRKRMIDA